MMKKVRGVLGALSLMPTVVAATTPVVTHKTEVTGIQSGMFCGVAAGLTKGLLSAAVGNNTVSGDDGEAVIQGSALVGYRQVCPSRMVWSVFLQGGYENQKIQEDILPFSVYTAEESFMIEHKGTGFVVAAVDLGLQASRSVVPFLRMGYKGQMMTTTLAQFSESGDFFDWTKRERYWGNGLLLGLGVDFALDSSWTMGLFFGRDFMRRGSSPHLLEGATVQTFPYTKVFSVALKYTFS